jgi:hypothetical protein
VDPVDPDLEYWFGLKKENYADPKQIRIFLSTNSHPIFSSRQAGGDTGPQADPELRPRHLPDEEHGAGGPPQPHPHPQGMQIT